MCDLQGHLERPLERAQRRLRARLDWTAATPRSRARRSATRQCRRRKRPTGRRWPASCHTARHRPSADRAGYTVTPHPSSITSPPPRIARRPFPLARTGLRAAPRAAFFPCSPGVLALADASCGDFCGDLENRSCRLRHASVPLPAFLQVEGLTTLTSSVGGTGLEPVTCRL
jgi:hypothetical protein